MKKLLMIIFISLIFVGCEEKSKLTVAVSIMPQETFVQKVSGDLVDIVVMIPPGASPANYEPSPKEMAMFNEAELYFHIDVAAEENILKTAEIPLVDLADIVDEVYPARYFDETVDEDADHDHDHTGRDPHIWLSPKRVIVMVEAIRDELIAVDGENEHIYRENAENYIEELRLLDQELNDTFNKLEKRAFIIYHPSYGYFADDYDLEMIAIEDEGKAATIKNIEQVIEYAVNNHIKFIFYQEEFDSQQAELIAKEINGTTIKVAPLSGDYINEMRFIATQLKEILD